MDTANIGKRVNSRVVDDEEEGEVFEDYTHQPNPVVFDHEAASIRSEAIDPIIALADQPPPEDVIEAWSVSQEYGVPIETFDRAIEWLTAFRQLWIHAEPLRQARIKRAKEMTHAAE